MSEALLMCKPDGFSVSYEINPWMRDQIGRVSQPLAASQWRKLHALLSSLARVELMEGSSQWPDLVFTANAGLPLASQRKFILSNFRHKERRGEKALNRAWFEAAGWSCIELPDEVSFEGAGDALFDANGRLWLGFGHRSDYSALEHLQHYLGAPVRALRLIDPNYYHLDTCFCPLTDGYALYLPGAFDIASRRLLQDGFGERLIELTDEEGRLFCANSVCIGKSVVMNQASLRLNRLLDGAGFTVYQTPMSEFMKSGGSAKCLTLCIAGALLCA